MIEPIQSHQNRTDVGVGRCFGTFGELLQGRLLSEERNFLVTLPIEQHATAYFTALPKCSTINVLPVGKTKVQQLVGYLQHEFKLETGGIVCLQSELAVGKGCASSTADMVAASRAIEMALDLSIPQSRLSEIIAYIEPSDGVMYQGIVSYYHCEGILRNFLGHLPRLTIIAIDEGGQIDTIEFNKQSRYFSFELRQKYENLLIDLEQAVRCGDLPTIGRIATLSAIMSQHILPKSCFKHIIDLHNHYNTLGVVVAHSGTYIGLLLDPSVSTYQEKLSAIISELAQHNLDVNIFYTCNTQRIEEYYVF